MKKITTLVFVIMMHTITHAQSWKLMGNSGTIPGTHFVGTTDRKELMLKVANEKSGYIDLLPSIANTSFGYQTLLDVTGAQNAAFGYQALQVNSSGFGNASFGFRAAYKNTTGYSNIAVGNTALYFNKSGYSNIAIGTAALYKNTQAHELIAIGDSALADFNVQADVGGNTAVGSKALRRTTTGYSNTAIGYNTLYNNTTGVDNVAIGFKALYSSGDAYNNISIGSFSSYKSTTGTRNIAVGDFTLYNNTTGESNTAIGDAALISNSTGSYNTALGQGANVVLSFSTNATAIGYDAKVDASNKVRIGNTSVTSIGGQVGWTNFSDERVKKDIKENVPGLKFIKALRAVTYRYNIAKENELLGVKDSARWEGKNDLEKINFSGFLAQEVDAAAKKIGYDFSGVDKTGKIMGLRYAEFVVPLVKAVQELSNENETLREKNNELETRIKKIEEMLATNANTITSNATQNSITQSSVAHLDQNVPNPSNGNTTIRYSIPSSVKQASLIITNMQGQVIKSYSLNNSAGQLTIATAQLSPGNYFYSLITDGKKADSKQMTIGR